MWVETVKKQDCKIQNYYNISTDKQNDGKVHVILTVN